MSFALRAFLSFIALLLMACAPKPLIELDWVKNKSKQAVPPRLKVVGEIEFQVRDSSQKLLDKGSVDAYFYILPHERYRIELKGPLGIQVASILWTPELWQVYIPDKSLLLQGEGDYIKLPIPGFERLNLHELVSKLWGDVLPNGWESAQYTEEESLTFLSWTLDSLNYEAQILNSHSQVIELKTPQELFKFKRWESQAEYTYPSLVEVQIEQSQLQLETDSWGIPKDFHQRLWSLRFPPNTRIREFTP